MVKMKNKILGIFEDFANENSICLYFKNRGHKYYFAEVWKTEVEPIGETGGVIYATDKIYVLINNIKDYIKFFKKYAICGGYGWLDTDKDIIDFIKNEKYPIITYQEWENLEHKEYFLD